MSKDVFTVLDHIDGIEVPGLVFENPVNEFWALIWLKQGLDFLYNQITPFDDSVRQKLNPNGDLTVSVIRDHPAFAGVPKAMLTSAFHWYAMSAYQYVTTVGAISFRQDSGRPKPYVYTEKIIPEVKTFRDKVAAHFAWNTKNKQDSDAERLMSVMPQLGFQDSRLVMGGFTLSLKSGGKTSDSGKMLPWSVIEIHERLRKRYWPSDIVQRQP